MRYCRNAHHIIDPYCANAILDFKRGWTSKKIARMVKDHCCILSEIMTKATILVKIYFTLIFPRTNRNENAHYL